MEIRIRTHEELRADRVTVEITGTGAKVTEFAETRLPSRNLYTDEEVANLQASEVELVAGPLRRRIAELERTLVASVKWETELEDELSRRASVIKKLENKIEAYDTDRHTERDRSDKAEKALAESRELVAFKDTVIQSTNEDLETVRTQRNELENQVAELTRRIDNARVLLSDARVVEARNKSVTTLETVLGGAIGKAVDTLG